MELIKFDVSNITSYHVEVENGALSRDVPWSWKMILGGHGIFFRKTVCVGTLVIGGYPFLPYKLTRFARCHQILVDQHHSAASQWTPCRKLRLSVRKMITALVLSIF